MLDIAIAVLFSTFAQPSVQISSIDLKSPFKIANIVLPSVDSKIPILPTDNCTVPVICSQICPITLPNVPHFSCKSDNLFSLSPNLAIRATSIPIKATKPAGPEINFIAFCSRPNIFIFPDPPVFKAPNKFTAFPPTIKTCPNAISKGPAAAATPAIVTIFFCASSSKLLNQFAVSVIHSTIFSKVGSRALNASINDPSIADFILSILPPRLSFIIVAISSKAPLLFTN